MPDFPYIRIYLDSNVLFSASRDANSEFHKLWRLFRVAPLTSEYAFDEVMRHLESPHQARRFHDLINKTQLVPDAPTNIIPPHTLLIAKDQPILAAALAAAADYLLTGDNRHFGQFHERGVGRLTVMKPADFLRLHRERLIP